MKGEPRVECRSEIADGQLSARGEIAVGRGSAPRNERAGRVAVVVSQQATQALAAVNRAGLSQSKSCMRGQEACRRVVEFMLSVWLAISPFVFRHASDATQLWAIDLAAQSRCRHSRCRHSGGQRGMCMCSRCWWVCGWSALGGTGRRPRRFHRKCRTRSSLAYCCSCLPSSRTLPRGRHGRGFAIRPRQPVMRSPKITNAEIVMTVFKKVARLRSD